MKTYKFCVLVKMYHFVEVQGEDQDDALSALEVRAYGDGDLKDITKVVESELEIYPEGELKCKLPEELK